jgi:hypothetical protein
VSQAVDSAHVATVEPLEGVAIAIARQGDVLRLVAG